MSKNTTIVVIIIIIVIIGIIVAVSYSNNQPSVPTDQSQIGTSPSPTDTASSQAAATNAPTPQNHAVSYTDQGFSPASITINNGDSVTWTNNSSRRMWVASNPHPTHTDLPGFDEMAAVNAGGSWTYTFSVLGSHGYHNHTNPSMGGTVIVQ